MASPKRTTCVFIMALVVAFLDISLSDSASEGNSTSLEEQFKQHMARVRAYPCRAQPHSFPAKEMLGGLLKSHQYTVPNWTVLHRCDVTSGCCLHETGGQQCGVKTEENVTLVFRAVNTLSSINGEPYMEDVRVEAINHTSCYCQEI